MIEGAEKRRTETILCVPRPCGSGDLCCLGAEGFSDGSAGYAESGRDDPSEPLRLLPGLA